MDKAARKRRRAPRSRTGCLECREHHRKCDERRPTCALCLKLGRDCTYGVRCRWGGRPFGKSIFGECIRGDRGQSTPVVRVGSRTPDTTGLSSFVYGTVNATSQGIPQPPSRRVPGTLHDHAACPENIQVERALSLLPGLSSAYRTLFDYFTHVAGSFTCNVTLKDAFCGTFIPIALESPFVMASALNLAAVHRHHSQTTVQDYTQLATLQVLAVERLRRRPPGDPIESVMAAILMLCYSEIITGREKNYSWRLHLEGAASLFTAEPSEWTIHSPNRAIAFIAKCFVSLVAIANISGRPPSTMVSHQAIRMVGDRSVIPRIDDFLAYSPDLVYIFCEIGALVQQRNAIPSMESTSATEVELKSVSLIAELKGMIGSSQKYPTDTSTMPPACEQGYLHVNESYHHAAILQIQLRVQRLTPAAEEIQGTVQRILELVSQIDVHSGPCLGVVLYFPLFTAGCCSTRWADRDKVLMMLQRMKQNIGFVNLQQGMDLLCKLWLHWDQYGESAPDITWEAFIDDNTDLILY